MKSNKPWPEVNNLTDAQQQGILRFLAVRRRFENIRRNSFIAVCLIFACVFLLNQIEGSPIPIWQIIVIVFSVVMAGIAEAMLFFSVKIYKKQLVDFGLPNEFAFTVSRINISKLDKEIAS